MFPLTPSDVALLACFILSVFLSAFFALGRPRTWFRDPLGWVIFGYSVTTVTFVGLIAYAIIFDQKVPEPVRLMAGVLMAAGIVAKTWAVHHERRKGRLARDRHLTSEGRAVMSSTTPTIEEVKAATKIWYASKRVLRTAFSTLLTLLPLAPQIVQVVQGQWDAAWLTPIAVQAVAINAVITGIMALPTVNAWLTKVGLGSVPASAVQKSLTTGNVYVENPDAR